ncbi:MAG: DUF6531 domain-containing protein, partial [Arenimonas sp.]
MRFRFFLLLLLALTAQIASANTYRNYIIGPWTYHQYVEGWPNYFNGAATYNHASEQSALSAALTYINSFPRACTAFSNPTPTGAWGDVLYGDSTYGVHVEIGAKYYPRAQGGSLYSDETISRCDPSSQAFLIGRQRELTCPAGYFPAPGKCWKPDNVPLPDNNDCSTCPAIVANGSNSVASDSNPYANGSNPIHGGLGYKSQTEKDYFSERSMLGFDRFYISATHREPSLLGNNWRHTYDRSLSYVDNPSQSLTTAVLNRPDRGRQYFTLTNGVWVPDAGFTERLEHLVGGGWLYTDNKDTKELYSDEGVLQKIEDRNGRALTMQYDLDQLIAVVDDVGSTLTFVYEYFDNIPTGPNNNDRKTRLTAVGLPDGQLIKFQYDANGMLERTIYPDDTPTNTADNPYRRYAYGNGTNATTYQLTGLFDERGIQFGSWQYNGSGQAISSEHGAPNSGIDKVSFVYNADGSSVVTNSNNESRTYTFALINDVKKVTSMSGPCSGCGVNFASRTYDAKGKPDITTDFAGTETDTNYNAYGRLVQKIESANKPATKRTTQIDYHPTFLVLPSEVRVYNASNVLEARRTYAYNSMSQVSAVCQIDPSNVAAMAYVCGSATNAPSGVRQSTTVYCEAAGFLAGNCHKPAAVLQTNGPRTDVNDVVTYSHRTDFHPSCLDPGSLLFCPYLKGDLWKVTNALGQVLEYTVYDLGGRAKQMKDANGVITDIEYNPRGWITARKVRGSDDSSEADDAITRVEYDATGQVTKVTQADGDFITFNYDAAHRLTSISDALNNSITYTLDSAGNRTAETIKDPSNTVKQSLSRVYDTLGRLQASKNAANTTLATLTYDANDNLDAVTDGLSRVTDQDVDPLNRLIKTIQDKGAGKINATTQFEYDARDNLIKVIDPKNLNTVYTYNGLNDLTQLSSPDTGATVYTYDAAGNRKTQTDARGKLSTYSYDIANRLTQVTVPTAAQNVYFDYDAT